MRNLFKVAGITLGVLVGAAIIVPLLIPTPPLVGTVPPEALADPDSKFIEVNGVKVHYKQIGSGEPTIILLHGFGASLFSWHAVMLQLAKHGTVIAYDRPAFGLTERPMPGEWHGENPYGPDAQVKLLRGLMDALGIRKAILVGNSAGGTIAVMTALAQPDSVQALVLVDPALGSSGAVPDWARPLMGLPQAQRLGVLVARQLATRGDDIIRTAWHDPTRITAETIEGYHKPLRAENWDRALWELTVATRPTDLRSRVKEIAAPTLVMTGDDDRIVPTAQTVAIAPQFRNGRLVVIPNCGHLPQEEKPEEFLQTVEQFVKGNLIF